MAKKFKTLLTFGEKMVGLSFNPSGDKNVAKVKELFSKVIDLLNEQSDLAQSSYSARFYSEAIQKAISAQMWAVKALTFKD